MSAVIQTAAHRARTLDGNQRLALLTLAAAYLGLDRLRDRLTAALPDTAPRPVWAHTLGPPHRQLTGHTGRVHAVAFGRLADGQPLLASAGNDGTVRLWDATTGNPVGGAADRPHRQGLRGVVRDAARRAAAARLRRTGHGCGAASQTSSAPTSAPVTSTVDRRRGPVRNHPGACRERCVWSPRGRSPNTASGLRATAPRSISP
jgi:WD40 repeat protein